MTHDSVVVRVWSPRQSDRPEADRTRRDTTAAESVSDWVRDHLGLIPDPVKKGLLDSTTNRVILNRTRQWGKSTITAAKAVHHAIKQPQSLTLAVSPSGRQSGEFVRKAELFAHRLK